ncbi:MAG: flagellar basal body P-ring formation protein FlgA [Gemmatimonadetes bacterium]|nr:flagellar basal body P-ring formation protein FlgA [Gemmatimonadota bacterium]
MTRSLVLALALLVGGGYQGDGFAQEPPPSEPEVGAATPSVDARAALVGQLAALWEVAPTLVRVELPADAPTSVDSVSIDGGSGDRWIATFVVDGYVVRRFVRVGHQQDVAVAAADIPRDHVLGPDDLAMGSQTMWGPPSAPGPIPDGWVAHRRIDAGEVLAEPAVRPPFMVRGGDEVEAVFVRGGVVLSIRAEALSSARSGEPVSVRMPSGKRMEGHAVAPGRVALHMGVNR